MAKTMNPAAGVDTEQDDQKTADATNRRITKTIKSRRDANDRRKRDLRDEWKRNVETRMGEVSGRGASAFDDDDGGDLQSEINPDWYLTKTKVANLYSQVPQVQMTHENAQYAAAIPPFAKSMNYELSEKRANVGVAMDEVLNDVVNASGIGFVFVDYVARFDQIEVPAIDTSMIPPHLVDLAVQRKMIPTTMADRVVSDKFLVSRISPLDGIWADDFVGSNFDDSDLVGYHGRLAVSDFQNEFEVDDDFIERAMGAAMPDRDHTLRTTDSRSTAEALAREVIEFDRIFYWRHRFDREETSFDAIWEIVLVKGMRKPVRHRPWAGQEYSEETGRYVGSCKFPVRVLTLTYVSDNPIVQSDTAAGRPQANDMRTSRSQLFANRRRSVPVRWYDVNRVGLDIQAQLNDGTWQGWIPTNGDGTKAVGEQARASYPAEDLSFDQETYADLLQSWGLTPGSLGNSTPGRKNQMEVGATSQGFATNIGKERAKVQSFFLGICEVLAGLMALYSDFPILTQQEKQVLEQTWDHKHILHDLVCKIRPDSMIVLDPQQRYQRLSNHLNMTVKSGYINPKPIIWEMTELAGLDPSEVVIDPQPPPPKEPQLSYRFSGKDDMMNPIVMALMVELNKAPSAQAIAAAKQLLLEAQKAPEPVSAPDSGAEGAPAPPPPGTGAPPPILHPAQAEAHQGWHTASRVAKRSRDMNSSAGGEA